MISKLEKTEISSLEKEELLEKVKKLEEENKKLQEENERLIKENQALKEIAEKDQLTGLYNRRYLEESLSFLVKEKKLIEEGKERREIKKTESSLLFIDIDDFKKINDTFGHKKGDEVLKTVAQLIRSEVRHTDIVARWGGEEILVVLIGADKEEAIKKAEKIRKRIEEFQQEDKIPLTVSIGVAPYSSKYGLDNWKDWIKDADQAMYQAKEKGKNKVEVFEEKELDIRA